MRREINVESAPGLVMIRGNMSSDETKTAAEGIANGIDGCKSVQSDLHVVRPSHCEVSKDNHEAVAFWIGPCPAKNGPTEELAW